MRITPNRMRELLQVYFIMGSNNCPKNPNEVLQEAIDGGITIFQFREKGKGALIGKDKVELAKSLQAICKKSNIPFIVNDDVELAIQIDADGIHIGQDDEALEKVRQKMGDKIIGVSAHSLNEAEIAIKNGADYLGIGPIYTTKTKEDAKVARGTEYIRKFREYGLSAPIVGIGGINPGNANSVINAGADGVSVITAISIAKNPKENAALLKSIF